MSHDMRFEEGPVPASEIGGECARCGRSYLKREGNEEGLCRTCEKPADGPLATRPEVAPLADSTRVVGPAETCDEPECSLSAVFKGKCREHYERSVMPVAEEASVVATNGSRLEKSVRCGIGGCEFESDWAPSIAKHKASHVNGVAPRATPAPKAPTKPKATAKPKKAIVLTPVVREAVASVALDGQTILPAAPDEKVFNLLLELAELGASDRECVLRYAVKRWLPAAQAS